MTNDDDFSTFIPAQMYISPTVGKNLRANITAFGTDSAGKSRIRTAHYSSLEKLPANEWHIKHNIIDNNPRYGFALGSSYKDTINIEDPCGYMVVMESAYLERLLKSANISKGQILNKCVWGKDKAKLCLLVEGSDEYEQAMSYTKYREMSVNISKVKPGNTVVFKSGSKLKYLGKYKCITINSADSFKDSSLISFSEHEHIFQQTNNRTKYTWIKEFKNPKIATILDPAELTEEESLEIVNDCIDETYHNRQYRTNKLYYVNPNDEFDVTTEKVILTDAERGKVIADFYNWANIKYDVRDKTLYHTDVGWATGKKLVCQIDLNTRQYNQVGVRIFEISEEMIMNPTQKFSFNYYGSKLKTYDTRADHKTLSNMHYYKVHITNKTTQKVSTIIL